MTEIDNLGRAIWYCYNIALAELCGMGTIHLLADVGWPMWIGPLSSWVVHVVRDNSTERVCGTIVMEVIKYNRSPLLAEFFCRFSKAPPQMHSKDQSWKYRTLDMLLGWMRQCHLPNLKSVEQTTYHITPFSPNIR
jgi:hypothetical protein